MCRIFLAREKLAYVLIFVCTTSLCELLIHIESSLKTSTVRLYGGLKFTSSRSK